MDLNPLIAIPVFNEGKNLPCLFAGLKKWKNNILFFDDGSTDNSLELIKSSQFNFITIPSNKGLANFYNHILAYADRLKCTHIITLDSDGQHPPGYIDDFIGKLQNGSIVIGNRFSDLENIPESKIASNLFAIMLTKQIFNVELPDVACGFRGFNSIINRKFIFKTNRFGIIYEQLFKHLTLDPSLISYVKIPAIYPKYRPLYTSQHELIGLLDAALLFTEKKSVKNIHSKALQSADFSIDLCGINFNARFEPPFGYIFNTNTAVASKYFKLISNST